MRNLRPGDGWGLPGKWVLDRQDCVKHLRARLDFFSLKRKIEIVQLTKFLN